MIQEAKKKASLGHNNNNVATSAAAQSPTSLTPTATSLSSTAVTSSIAASPPPSSPTHQQTGSVLSQQIANQQTQQQQRQQTTSQQAPGSSEGDKLAHRLSPICVESIEKSSAEGKCEAAVVGGGNASPKEQRARVDGDGKQQQQQQYLHKFGKIRTPVGADEEKKPSSYKDLKEFGEQFKLSETKSKKRLPGKGTDTKTAELAQGKVKSDEKSADGLPKPTFSKSEEAPKSQDARLATSSESCHSSSHAVTTAAASASTTVVTGAGTSTSSTTPSPSEPPSPSSMKSALNPSAKEFNLNPSAKEFNPGNEGAKPYSPSPKPGLAKQPSFPGDAPHALVQQQQAYYHSQAVMIHPNGSEVMGSPNVQSVPVKQIYARPYMSAGPGGQAVYSIPAAVEFSGNAGNSGSPQIIASPQSGFIPAQNMAGQQVIIIQGPNGSVSYQPVVPGGQGQQYYSMQHHAHAMIRCVAPGGVHNRPIAF